MAVHDDAPLPAAKTEFLAWLEEVAEPHQSVWGSRLRSNLDHPHFSVRLELFLHHYFKEHGYKTEIEPEMAVSPNKADFLVLKGSEQYIVEAKVILAQVEISQQHQRLSHLADDLGRKLSGDVIIHPTSTLPGTVSIRRIRSQIEGEIGSGARQVLEFDVSGVHKESSYSLTVIFIPKDIEYDDHHGVKGIISQAHTLKPGSRLR
ncbi:MAG: hypothetical protein IIC33_07415, partial [Chloroflexi bacterium]|nr:hypothetical protein [Chloroflexota bacterium]